MAKFKVIVSDPTEGTSKMVELEEGRAAPLIGKRIGEVMEGTIVNLPGQKIQVMGGSDKDGFPMRPSVHGGVRKRIILAQGVGYNSTNEGQRRRKTIRGNTITDEIVQINMMIVGKPKQTNEEKKTRAKAKKKPSTEEENRAENTSDDGNQKAKPS